ncbi:MAG: asparagine synthase (glutamine-hydrolyzing) [Gammaproteobacteria bacterium]|nr:asparagine synthase (glutamine-hydrolyzing) [Gammaproteobacteria bacterium]
MCGIAGFSGSFDELLLSRMASVLQHRGPDDGGHLYFKENNLGLAHRRLSIIDLSAHGQQPMWDENRRAVIIFNGEIYNYVALRRDLILKGYIFRSESDTEVLVNAYLCYGHDVLCKLNGIFTFAIWDYEKRELFIARDHVGVKPFYYSLTSKGFIFASEMKAILCDESVSSDLDSSAIYYYLTHLWCPAPKTILSQVKKLEPGHAMIVQEGRISKHWKYYDLPYDQEISIMSEDESILAVREAVEQAVQRQLISDVPVGAFLSGGLDSSAVVACAKKIMKDEVLQCFTVSFEENIHDKENMSSDLMYAKKVAKYLSVPLKIVHADVSIVDRLEDMIYHMDEPQADPAPINVMIISELARQNNIKVLLSGAGGDDIFTGYRRHFALNMERTWDWLPQTIRNKLKLLSSHIPVTTAMGRRLRKSFEYAEKSSVDRLISYFLWINPAGIENILSEPVMQDVYKEIPSRSLLESITALPNTVLRLNQMLYLEGKYFLPDHNLNYTDKMSMAHGVEVRVPLLDIDLISLAARIDPKLKQRGTEGKWIFKKAMETYLPREVIYRAKAGFGAPLRYWITHDLKEMIGDYLSTASINNRGIFNAAAVRRLIEENANGKIDAAYSIFAMLCIELWCRRFIDARSSFLQESRVA